MGCSTSGIIVVGQFTGRGRLGIHVAAKVVSYDDSHQKLINTCPKFNPTKIVVQKLVVHSVFQRVAERSKSGDGNPLMYALKGIRGYSISRVEICRFLPNFYEILASLTDEYAEAVLVPMPSSHKVAVTLARRAQRFFPGSRIRTDLLVKRTCAEVHAELVQLAPPVSHATEFKQLLAFLKKNADLTLSLKDVDTKLRHLTNPLAINVSVAQPDAPIVLIDDLMATGTTLLRARDLFREQGSSHEIKGLCLFSKL